MAVAKQNGDVIPFVKQKDYIMVNTVQSLRQCIHDQR